MPKHKSVLLHEVVESLDLKNGEVFVDATYGSGGHSKEILRQFPKVKVVTIDQDPLTGADITGNFQDLDKLLADVRPDAILFDLGISSDQLAPSDGAGRGFSFQKDEPLDMRMSGKGITAADILNSFDEHAIELILRGFGEEKFSKKIAREIVRRREIKPFETTFDLVEVVGDRKGRIHPATKVFQALRIAVNDELTALEVGLSKAWEILNPGGRLVVISFHSLEDRIVKNFFREKGEKRKPIVPSAEEVKRNPRSRNAKLRIIKKI
ncbi:MAG: 16S rRNA (cytosine(1402)-N(4))-methyltransferase RsmH [Candidatus Zambryskibacteria bacterium]|nr:16S rRNA (cytosine(1402)-N(4))-methyltransferase RsmH [Candidatus Zambryskibacteria bacterium]